MFWKSVELDGYLPFTHSGISHVKIDFTRPATAILGGNGSGKSSLLRQLVPSPANRPDFSKTGRIVKTIEHGGDLYELSSDFSNATAPHSFKKNGAELNVSGTTDVQKDLIVEHFGLQNFMNDILAGDFHVCSAQKAFRKQMFSSCYPSDLTFVLEYHKKVCSQIRAFGNQIKLLQQREGALTASLIDQEERERLGALREGALAILDRIDKINLVLENEIEQLSKNPLLQLPYHQVDTAETIQLLDDLRYKYVHMYKDIDKARCAGETIDHEHLKEKWNEYSNEVMYLNKTKKDTEEILQTLRFELDKFAGLKNASAVDKKTELSREVEIIKKEIEILKVDPQLLNTPTIPMNKLVYVLELMGKIEILATELHGYAGNIIGSEQLNKLKADNENLKFSMKTLLNERMGHDQTLSQSKSRLYSLTKNSFPPDCVRVCALRATLEGSIRDCKLRIEQLEKRIGEIDTQLRHNQEQLDHNEKVIQESAPAFPIMKELYDILAENFLVEIALKGETFVDCLNNHSAEIVNRLIQAVDASKKYYRYKELNDRMTQIEETLSMMETVDNATMSTAIIESIIAEKEAKLEEGIKKIASIDDKVKYLYDHMETIGETGKVLKVLDDTINDVQTNLNIEWLKTRIDFDRKIIREHLAIKGDLSAKLREIEFTLSEQKRTLDILETEIKPTLNNLRTKKLQWELVEAGLSPSKGLPCIYLIRFINRLIAKANALIKEVWCYDLEMVYLDEGEDLDFTIEVLINKSTTVKDISICSKGQQAIIDLAMTLAICIERGWLNNYPCKFDEVDAALTEQHRTSLVGMISRLIDDGILKQMFLVNHFAAQTGMSNCESVCLSSDGIVLPSVVNEHAEIY